MDAYQTVLTPEQQQRKLEDECLALGIDRYFSRASEGADTVLPGQRLLAAAVDPLGKAIEGMIEEALAGKAGRSAGIAKFLAQFDPYRASFVVARRIIHSITDKVLLSTAAVQVANALEECINHDHLKEANPKLYKQLLKKINGTQDEGYRHVVMMRQMEYAEVARIKWGLPEKTRLGTTLIHTFAETTGLVEVVKMTRGHHDTPYFVMASQKTLMWLEKAHAKCSLMQPVFMPMVCKPTPWTAPYGGGYLSAALQFPIMKTGNKNYLEELKHWSMPMVYRSINALQETPWRVNEAVLRVAREVWDGGGKVGALPSREPIPLPPQNYDVETQPEAHKKWKKAAAMVYDENAHLVSKRVATETKLQMAEKMAEYEEFFFVHALDWRGRE